MKPLEQKTKDPDFITRPYRKEDRERVRQICCETGYLGNPIDEIFIDRDLFADYLTRYYTDMEPETCWVGEKNGEVVTYLLGCKRWNLNNWWGIWNGVRLAAKAGWRFITGQYDAKSRKFLWWVITKSWRETPPAPSPSAHFHFNSMPGYRKMGIARDLLITLLEDLKKHRIPRVVAQMSTYDNRRTEKVYEYLGWQVINKRRVSKYDGKLGKDMYLTTILMEFSYND